MKKIILVLGLVACDSGTHTAPECGEMGNGYFSHADSFILEATARVTDDQARQCLEGLLKQRALHPTK